MKKHLYDFIVLFEWSLSSDEMNKVVEEWKEDLDKLSADDRQVLRGFYKHKLNRLQKTDNEE